MTDTPRTSQSLPPADVAVGPPLPPVDWSALGQAPPVKLPLGARDPADPLPAADIVILTWTAAEWSALDHVFLNSHEPRAPYAKGDRETWRDGWTLYSRGADDYHADKKSGALWGRFALVSITDRSGRPWRALLFKSDAHLAHPPWIDGLSAMLRCILADTRADRIYSIGTAGGARGSQRLGDAVITNAAQLDLQRPENSGDADNGAVFRCKTWFPATTLSTAVEKRLLFPMDRVVTRDALAALFARLAHDHAGDPDFAGLALDDLLNDALRPELLGSPQIRPMKDVPLLTTDFYFIAGGQDAAAFSFLEMDDAVIAREAERAGVRYAFIRNVSDPIVRSRTGDGRPIAAPIRADWSGKIYEAFGLYTSHNGALATWATIAGEGEAAYNPARGAPSGTRDLPLEVALVYGVRACGTCSFFWPDDKKHQPYGPYTAYDFDVDVPYAALADRSKRASRWVTGRTRPPAFPNPEVIDGCRKAPIMTIGINPNMTAFAPGTDGASWAYPNFSDHDGGDPWAKYAWYYRFRTVFQERLDLDFVRRFILPEGQIVAPRGGRVTGAARPDLGPRWSFTVRYDGDADDTAIEVPGVAGDAPYVLVVDTHPPNDRFEAGQLLAGRLSVPGGIRTEVLQQPQTYYTQFEPVLARFGEFLRDAGHRDVALRVGEDVAQHDMVACASPHWNPGFLGGSRQSIDTIVDNCVRENAWAIKQLLHTRPAILFIVSKSSWDMFHAQFGAHIKRDPPLSARPVDHDFTLLAETTDPSRPCTLEIDVTEGDARYTLKTRVVITPHFSYSDNFAPQYRLSPADWAAFVAAHPDALRHLEGPGSGFEVVTPDPKYPNDYRVVRLSGAPEAAAALAAFAERFPAAAALLRPHLVDAHAAMAGVLEQMYRDGALVWRDATDARPAHLARSEGSCRFCVNERWSFYRGGCPYGKDREAQPPAGFLERVAARVVATGRPAPTSLTTDMTPRTDHSERAKDRPMKTAKTTTIYAIRPGAGAGLSFERVWTDALGADFSHVVPVRIRRKPYLLGYDAARRTTGLFALGDAAPFLTPQPSDIRLGDDPWDSLEQFVLGNVPYVVAYQRQSGRFSFFALHDDFTASRPYSLYMLRGTPTPGFTTIRPFTSLSAQYVLGYNFDDGHVAAYSVQVTPTSEGGEPPLLMLNRWYHQWAAGWSRFAFFKLGGANFFFKINTKKLNVNIDHLQDDPAAGSIEVGSHLEAALPDALAISDAAALPWAHGEPHLVTYVRDTGASKILRVHADCLGWDIVGDATLPPGAARLTTYRIGDTSFVLLAPDAT